MYHYEFPINPVAADYRSQGRIHAGFWNGGHRSSDEGGSIEAPQALSAWDLVRECPPPHWGWGLGRGPEGLWRLPQFFLTFWLKIVHFGVYSDKNSQFIRPIAGLKTAFKWQIIVEYLLLTNVFSSVPTVDTDCEYDRLTAVPGIRMSNICTDRDHAVY